MHTVRSHNHQDSRDGFVATMPLWLADIPFAVAFALLAQTNGSSNFEAGPESGRWLIEMDQVSADD